MNRIKKAFDNKKAFIGFLTAGDPTLEKTEEFVLEMDCRWAGNPGGEYTFADSGVYDRQDI